MKIKGISEERTKERIIKEINYRQKERMQILLKVK
jgi:hypothetical protein